MKVLIIGSEGYIGSRMCSTYFTDATKLDIGWFGDFNQNFLKMDYRNLTLEDVESYDAIVLLAGHSSVKMCVGNWYSTYNNNVRNFMYLLRKMDIVKTKTKLIYASSSSVYGNTFGEVADETFMSKVGINEYDVSKSMIDQVVQMWPKIEWYGLRFGTVNGFSPNLRSELMLNSMTRNALQNGVVRINNETIHRAILGLDDLIRAVRAIIYNGSMEKSGFYNLCSFNATVGELAEKVSSITNAKIERTPDLPNPYDFRISNKKFEDAFDFKFAETADSIINQLVDSIDYAKLTNRDNKIIYDYHIY